MKKYSIPPILTILLLLAAGFGLPFGSAHAAAKKEKGFVEGQAIVVPQPGASIDAIAHVYGATVTGQSATSI